MQKRKLTKSDLPHLTHSKLIDAYTAISLKIFQEMQSSILKDIKSLLKSDKLIKSDKLKNNWTGDIPKLQNNLEDKVAKTIEKYLKALRYFMLGDYAGKEAKEAAESLGLISKIKPGTAYGVYLQAVDTQRDYFKQIYDIDPPNISKEILKETFDVIQRKTDRIVTESIEKYKNKLIDAVDLAVQQKNIENLGIVHEEAHDLLSEDKDPSKAVKQAEKYIDIKAFEKNVSNINEKASTDWETNSDSIYSMSSSVGTHQAVVEIFGQSDDSLKAVLLNMQDEKCCDSCEKFARMPDGSLKLHKLDDFKPAGYNYGKKKADWHLCICPIHPRCRCSIIYVPAGAKVDRSGIITF